jgi:hypothetical protein
VPQPINFGARRFVVISSIDELTKAGDELGIAQMIDHKTFSAMCRGEYVEPAKPDAQQGTDTANALVTNANSRAALATKLEALSDRALDKLAEIMSLPLANSDPAFPSVLRSQTTAAGVALNTQVRVDEVALRKHEADRMPELLRLAAEVRARLPPLEELRKQPLSDNMRGKDDS